LTKTGNKPRRRSSFALSYGTAIMAEEKKPEPQSPKKAGDPEPVKEMSEKEQMEAYEESLKDTDWGHQPC